MGRLDGKRALIWGGGSGIGCGAAEAMAAEGARVFIATREARRLVSAAARLGGSAIMPKTLPKPDGTLVKALGTGVVMAAHARRGCLQLGEGDQ